MGKRTEIDYLVGTCISAEIGEFAKKYGKPSSWKNACRMIGEYSIDLYNELALNLNNPWSEYTNIKTTKDGKFLHIVHSCTDYIFKLK